MRPAWTDRDLLDAWEEGLDRSIIRRALALLAAADPEVAPAELARLTIGRRDARLLDLREALSGRALPVSPIALRAACGWSWSSPPSIFEQPSPKIPRSTRVEYSRSNMRASGSGTGCPTAAISPRRRSQRGTTPRPPGSSSSAACSPPGRGATTWTSIECPNRCAMP